MVGIKKSEILSNSLKRKLAQKNFHLQNLLKIHHKKMCDLNKKLFLIIQKNRYIFSFLFLINSFFIFLIVECLMRDLVFLFIDNHFFNR